jgi:hypothetical protein
MLYLVLIKDPEAHYDEYDQPEFSDKTTVKIFSTIEQARAFIESPLHGLNDGNRQRYFEIKEIGLDDHTLRGGVYIGAVHP